MDTAALETLADAACSQLCAERAPLREGETFLAHNGHKVVSGRVLAALPDGQLRVEYKGDKGGPPTIVEDHMIWSWWRPVDRKRKDSSQRQGQKLSTTITDRHFNPACKDRRSVTVNRFQPDFGSNQKKSKSGVIAKKEGSWRRKKSRFERQNICNDDATTTATARCLVSLGTPEDGPTTRTDVPEVITEEVRFETKSDAMAYCLRSRRAIGLRVEHYASFVVVCTTFKGRPDFRNCEALSWVRCILEGRPTLIPVPEVTHRVYNKVHRYESGVIWSFQKHLSDKRKTLFVAKLRTHSKNSSSDNPDDMYTVVANWKT